MRPGAFSSEWLDHRSRTTGRLGSDDEARGILIGVAAADDGCLHSPITPNLDRISAIRGDTAVMAVMRMAFCAGALGADSESAAVPVLGLRWREMSWQKLSSLLRL